MSWRALKHSHTRTPSPQGAQLSNGRPPPLFIERSLKLAVTLKSRKNRVCADSPPYKARTVCHFKPNGYILNKCFSESTITARADSPPHKWRTSAVHLDTQYRTIKFLRPFQVLKADCLPTGAGRSAVHFGPPSRAKISSVRVQMIQL